MLKSYVEIKNMLSSNIENRKYSIKSKKTMTFRELENNLFGRSPNFFKLNSYNQSIINTLNTDETFKTGDFVIINESNLSVFQNLDNGILVKEEPTKELMYIESATNGADGSRV